MSALVMLPVLPCVTCRGDRPHGLVQSSVRGVRVVLADIVRCEVCGKHRPADNGQGQS